MIGRIFSGTVFVSAATYRSITITVSQTVSFISQLICGAPQLVYLEARCVPIPLSMTESALQISCSSRGAPPGTVPLWFAPLLVVDFKHPPRHCRTSREHVVFFLSISVTNGRKAADSKGISRSISSKSKRIPLNSDNRTIRFPSPPWERGNGAEESGSPVEGHHAHNVKRARVALLTLQLGTTPARLIGVNRELWVL